MTPRMHANWHFVALISPAQGKLKQRLMSCRWNAPYAPSMYPEFRPAYADSVANEITNLQMLQMIHLYTQGVLNGYSMAAKT